jgi:hypothetical protein
MTENPPRNFTFQDAYDISRMVKRRRPGWNQEAIIERLQKLADAGASLVQVTAAAEKTWNNPKASTPAALLWDEHLKPDERKPAGILTKRMCMECTVKVPLDQITRFGGIWKCRKCIEAA